MPFRPRFLCSPLEQIQPCAPPTFTTRARRPFSTLRIWHLAPLSTFVLCGSRPTAYFAAASLASPSSLTLRWEGRHLLGSASPRYRSGQSSSETFDTCDTCEVSEHRAADRSKSSTTLSWAKYSLEALRGGGAEAADIHEINDRPIMSAEESSEEPQHQGVNGMDLIIDGWFHERGQLWPGQAMSFKVKEVLDHHRSDFQDVLVFESTNHGTVLVLDGAVQCTERDEFSYQEMIAHIPLFAHPDPKKVLVIGGGDGGVLREIARHPGVEEIVLCEIDGDVIEVSKKYLPFMSKGFDDPRVKVHIMDGAKFMDENKDSFDVIITDSSDPIGPASVLFETPFYNAMHASLREGGIVCTQGECIWLHVDLIKPLVSSISGKYMDVGYAYTTIPSYPSGQIGFIIATKGRGSCNKPARIPSEEMQKELRYYTPEIHEVSFVLPAFAKRAIFGE